MHPESLVQEFFLDPLLLNIPKFLNLNNMLNTLI